MAGLQNVTVYLFEDKRHEILNEDNQEAVYQVLLRWLEKMIQDKIRQAEVIAIVGPTASGKTALSIKLAKKYNGEIINGDSMQVYRGLDIGTAKITEEEMEGVPHHLLSFKEPTEAFSVADYQRMVRTKIAEIRAREKLPIIVGALVYMCRQCSMIFNLQRSR